METKSNIYHEETTRFALGLLLDKVVATQKEYDFVFNLES